MSNMDRSSDVPMPQTNLVRHENTRRSVSPRNTRESIAYARKCTIVKEVANEQATRGRTILPDKTEIDDNCADGNESASTMDGFSFGFLTRLPKFRSQIQFQLARQPAPPPSAALNATYVPYRGRLPTLLSIFTLVYPRHPLARPLANYPLRGHFIRLRLSFRVFHASVFDCGLFRSHAEHL